MNSKCQVIGKRKGIGISILNLLKKGQQQKRRRLFILLFISDDWNLQLNTYFMYFCKKLNQTTTKSCPRTFAFHIFVFIFLSRRMIRASFK